MRLGKVPVRRERLRQSELAEWRVRLHRGEEALHRRLVAMFGVKRFLGAVAQPGERRPIGMRRREGPQAREFDLMRQSPQSGPFKRQADEIVGRRLGGFVAMREVAGLVEANGFAQPGEIAPRFGGLALRGGCFGGGRIGLARRLRHLDRRLMRHRRVRVDKRVQKNRGVLFRGLDQRPDGELLQQSQKTRLTVLLPARKRHGEAKGQNAQSGHCRDERPFEIHPSLWFGDMAKQAFIIGISQSMSKLNPWPNLIQARQNDCILKGFMGSLAPHDIEYRINTDAPARQTGL